ncbi:protein Wnt-11b-1-like [Zophobas morio]|uniref:protein Wnt-11b-1-like n=1 Tax=Zophobas morio TaxID=2755281 RepID=UPI0030831493
MNSRIFMWIMFFPLLWEQGCSIRWLSLQHSNLHWNLSSVNNNPGRGIRSGTRSPCGIARRRFGLAKLQAKLCRSTMEAMPHVQKAATVAAETCQTVFQDRRWNCSSIVTAPYLTPDLTRATREQAYVYAISSAALTYTMARACASGTLYHCTCASKPNEPPNGNFQWGGCGDNIYWGVYFAKRFIDNVEKLNFDKTRKRRRGNFEEKKNLLLREEIAAVNLHNNRVGRKVVKENLRTQCKCHGVSGSCNIKTCWKGLPPLIDIGQRLLRQYTNAKEVSRSYIEGNFGKKTGGEQLLFLSKSPDYCTKDMKLGSFGTAGRKCNVTTEGPDSCRQLCCGRGYRTLVEEKIERCQCKYYNCCYVKCNICRTMTQVYECS